MILRRLLPTALAALPLVLSACVHNVVLDLEAHRNLAATTNLDATAFHVLQISDSSVREGGELRKREVQRLLGDALATRGMYVAPGPDQAQVVLDVQYGSGPSKLEVQDISAPERGLPNRVRVDVVREKFFRLTARAAAAPPTVGDDTAAPEVLWTVEVRNLADEEDLRRNLPLMIAVAAEWAARNTHGRRTFTATMENGTVIYVSGGYDQPGIAPTAAP